MADNRKPITRRPGATEGFNEWLGIRKEGNAASIGSNQLRHLENMRWQSPDLVGRGGQTKVNGTALPGCIDGIFEADFDFDDMPGDVYHAGRATGIGGGDGIIWRVERGASTITYFDTGIAAYIEAWTFGTDKNTIWAVAKVGTNANLYEIKLEPRGTLAAGSYPVASATIRGTVAVGAAPEDLFSSVAYHKASGHVYVGRYAGDIADARVYKWDGSTFAVELTPGGSGTLGGIQLYYFPLTEQILWFDTNGDQFRIRSAAGVWSTLAYAQGYGGSDVNSPDFASQTGSGADLGSVFVVSGYTDSGSILPALVGFDGSAVIVTNEITGETDHRMSGLAVANGNLYYARTNGRIGVFDGKTYTNTLVTMSPAERTRLAVADNKLWALIGDAVGGGGTYRLKYALLDSDLSLSASWTTLISNTLDNETGASNTTLQNKFFGG